MVASCSLTTNECNSAVLCASGKNRFISSCASWVSCSFVSFDTEWAPLMTSARCCRGPALSLITYLLNTQSTLESSKPTNSKSVTGFSYQRLIETIGEFENLARSPKIVHRDETSEGMREV